MSKHTPETVEDGHLFTSRLAVPGGWIYRSYDKENQVMGMAFVPIPTSAAPELLEACKAVLAHQDVSNPDEDTEMVVKCLRGAIAKAEGEP